MATPSQSSIVAHREDPTQAAERFVAARQDRSSRADLEDAFAAFRRWRLRLGIHFLSREEFVKAAASQGVRYVRKRRELVGIRLQDGGTSCA